MTRWKKTVIVGVLEIAALVSIHAALLSWLSTHDVVSRIFAAGQHVQVWMLLLTGTFLLVRFLAVFALPGLILTRIGLTILDWHSEKRTDIKDNSGGAVEANSEIVETR